MSHKQLMGIALGGLAGWLVGYAGRCTGGSA
jgi:hypothetical protein